MQVRPHGLAVPWRPLPALLAAVALAGLALALRASLTAVIGARPMLNLMLFPVILAAYAGGLWPGLLATVLVALGVAVLFVPPVMDWRMEDPYDIAQWVMFVANAVLASVLTQALHSARRRGEQIADERRRADLQLRTVLTNARCILWHATVWAREGWREDPANECHTMGWKFAIEDEDAAERVLPLGIEKGQSYAHAWLHSRPKEYWPGLRARAFEALRDDAPEYQQTYPCIGHDGRERWLAEHVAVRKLGPAEWQLVGVCTDITTRMADSEIMRAVLTHARCILWQAEVTDPIHASRAPDDRTTPLEWQAEVLELAAAQHVVPLAVADGESYLRAWQECRQPDDRRMTHAVGLAAILESQPQYGFDYRCTDRYGELHWLQEQATVIPLSPGRWRVFGVCTDITDRKAADEELRLVLTHARCILWSADVSDPLGERRPPHDADSELRWETRIADEAAALQVLPLALREGESFRYAFHRHRDQDDKLATDANARRSILAGEPSYEQEFRCVDRDGQVRWLHEDVVVLPGPAHHWHLFGVTTDITQRKHDEEERQAILTHARCILWRAVVSRRDGAPDDAPLVWQCSVADEHAALEVLPLAIEEGRTYMQSWLSSRHPDDALLSRHLPRAAILAGDPSYSMEFRCTDRFGRLHWLHEDTAIVPAGDGRWRLFGVGTEITALKTAEDEVRALNAELEQRVADRTAELLAANEELEGFAYAVSHDLRAPLRAMSGFSDALMEDHHAALPDEARVFLDQIVQASQRMGALIDGLLVLSRATRGELLRDELDLSAMAERVIGDLVVEEPLREVAWEVEPGLTARGDGRMVDAVLRNLLGNAFKYTAKTERPHVRFRSRVVDGQTRYEVSDNGAGFDEAYAAKLYQPFQRLHRQDEFPGLGIGLATAQRIIRRHGGQLEAAGTVGGGATFAFTLPDAAVGNEQANGPEDDSDR